MTGDQLDRVWAQQCTRKHSYATEARARRAAAHSEQRSGLLMKVYRCQMCPGWHVARVKRYEVAA